MINFKKFIAVPVVLVAVITGVAACSTTSGSAPSTGVTKVQGSEQGNTSTAASNEDIGPYGASIFAQMHGPTDEMVNDGTRDLTLNNPNRIGYVYVYDNGGDVMATYTIKGKVSSTESQLTESQDVTEEGQCYNHQGWRENDSNCGNVVDSISDDGTYGGEEGGPSGVFFYTTSNVLVELGGTVSWFYSDAPLNLTSKPILVLPIHEAPTSGVVKTQTGK